MNPVAQWLMYLFGPTIAVVCLAVILSFLPIKPPKYRGDSWFKHRDW